MGGPSREASARSTQVSAAPSASQAPYATFATALGINNRGEIVGTADGQAFLYSDGRFTILNTQIVGGSVWTAAWGGAAALALPGPESVIGRGAVAIVACSALGVLGFLAIALTGVANCAA